MLVVPQRRLALEKLVLHATSLRIPIVELEGGTLTQLAGFDGHQGVALVVAPRRFATLEDILARAAERGEAPFVLALDSLEDPQNVGTLLRSAEAAGVHGILFPTRRQAPLTPSAVKASAGAVEHLLLCPVDDLAGALADLRGHGLRVAGAEADAALTARQSDLRGPLAIVVGSEGQGLGPAIRRRCDMFMRIPMRGAIGSLNAAVAGSVLLFEAVAQRDPDGTGAPPTAVVDAADVETTEDVDDAIEDVDDLIEALASEPMPEPSVEPDVPATRKGTAKGKPKAAAATEPARKAKPASKPKAKAKAVAAPTAAAARSEAEPDDMAEADPDAQAKVEPDENAKAKGKAKAGSSAKAKAASKPKPKAKPEPKPTAKRRAKAEPEAAAAIEPTVSATTKPKRAGKTKAAEATVEPSPKARASATATKRARSKAEPARETPVTAGDDDLLPGGPTIADPPAAGPATRKASRPRSGRA